MNPEPEMFGKIVEECKGCERVTNADCCQVYVKPDRQHSRLGGCPMRTHNRKAIESTDLKINPLKMSKRGIKQ